MNYEGDCCENCGRTFESASDYCDCLDGEWRCREHDLLVAEGQPCPKCLDVAGDLLADCLETE